MRDKIVAPLLAALDDGSPNVVGLCVNGGHLLVHFAQGRRDLAQVLRQGSNVVIALDL